MATIDIRKYSENITSIDFSDSDSVDYESDGVISIYDNTCNHGCKVFISDIPNLIKALQKAQELWGDE